jgi:CrcB protein
VTVALRSRGMERFLWICLAGAAGTGTRYLVQLWAGNRFGAGFPYGTLIVNAVGCFLIALLLELALRGVRFPGDVRVALTTGFMGGLTTYSTFNYETMRLVQDGSSKLAWANLGATLLGCWVAGALGLLLARRLVGA